MPKPTFQQLTVKTIQKWIEGYRYFASENGEEPAFTNLKKPDTGL